jgi:hypothetical protein
MTMTTPVSPPVRTEAVSSYRATGGLARLAGCGYCHAGPREPCVTGQNGAGGDHLARLARAERRGLIGADDLDAALAAAGDGMFSGATVIYAGSARQHPTSGIALPAQPAA